MVSKCVRLWSSKVERENTGYINEAKKKIVEKIEELEDVNKGIHS